MRDNHTNERIRTFLLPIIIVFVGTLLVCLVFSISTGNAIADGARSQDGDKTPTMLVGDKWTFHKESYPNKKIVSQGVTMIMEKSVEDTTYTVIEANSGEYKVSVSSTTTTTGTWESSGFDGDFTDTITTYASKSYRIYGASDMALKSEHIEAKDTVSLEIMGMPQSTVAAVVSDSTVDPPLDEFGFANGNGKLSIGDEWSQTSTISTTSTITPEGQPPTTVSETTKYTVDLKVEEITDYNSNVGGSVISCFRISQTGTKVAGSDLKNVGGSLYFSTDTKSLVCDQSEGTNLTAFTLVVPKPDLMIDTSKITPSTTTPIVDDVVKITANVSNIGSAEASNVIVTFYDGTEKIDEKTITSISSSSSNDVSVNWTPKTDGSHTIKVVLDEQKIITEISETNNQAQITITVAKKEDYNVLLGGEARGSINSGGTLNFMVNVTNRGASSDIISITVTGTPTGWTATLNKNSVDLNPGATTSINVNVVASQNAEGGTTADIVVKGISQGNPSKTSSHTFRATVNTYRDFNISCSQTSKNIIPNTSTVYTITIKNTGNVNDNINLNRSDPGSDWSASMDTQSPILLAPKASQVVNITVEPSSTATPGSSILYLRIDAISQDGTTKKSLNLTATLIEPTYGVEVTISPEKVSIAPNGTTNAVLTVKNTGNVPDTMGLKITSEQSATQSWASLGKPSINVDANTQGEVNISITLPKNALAGSYRYTIEGTSSGPAPLPNSVVLTIEVNQTYGVNLTLPSATLSLYPGESVNSSITVKNKGNGGDTFDLSVINLPVGWGKKITLNGSETSNVALGSYNMTNVNLSLTTPQPSKSSYTGSYAITIKSDSLGDSTESCSIIINVEVLPMGVFKGTVTDKNNRDKTISGATITVKKDSEIIKNGTTDDDGCYYIEVRPGIYDIIISKSGYVNKTRRDMEVVGDTPTVIDFSLESIPITTRPPDGDNFGTPLLLSGVIIAIAVGAIMSTRIIRKKVPVKKEPGLVRYQTPEVLQSQSKQYATGPAGYQTQNMPPSPYDPYATGPAGYQTQNMPPPPYDQYGTYPSYSQPPQPQQQPYQEQAVEQNTAKCYNCGYPIPITSSARPLTIYCPSCGSEGVLD